jgi:hypothetical protein
MMQKVRNDAPGQFETNSLPKPRQAGENMYRKNPGKPDKKSGGFAYLRTRITLGGYLLSQSILLA